MQNKNDLGFPFLLALILITLLAVGGALVIYQAEKSQAEMPSLYEIPAFEFVDQNGQPYGSKDFQGKITVVDFSFTHCQSICPVMNAKMAELYRLYASYDFVRFVSISVDPERDSIEVLKRYADSWGVNDDRWVFLRAPIDEVVRVMEGGFKLPGGELPMGHSAKLTLVDQNGVIRSYHDSFDDAALEALKRNIRQLAKEQK